MCGWGQTFFRNKPLWVSWADLFPGGLIPQKVPQNVNRTPSKRGRTWVSSYFGNDSRIFQELPNAARKWTDLNWEDVRMFFLLVPFPNQQMVNRWNLTVMWSCIIGSNHNSFQDGIWVAFWINQGPKNLSNPYVLQLCIYIYIYHLPSCIQLYTDIHMYVYIYIYVFGQ